MNEAPTSVVPASLPSYPSPFRHSRSHSVIPAPTPSYPSPFRHSRSHSVIPAPTPSFPLPLRHSRSHSVIPEPLPSFPLPLRHSRSHSVIPAPTPSFPLPLRHTRAPSVIPAPTPSFPLPLRHSRSHSVIPAPTPSFPRKRESIFSSVPSFRLRENDGCIVDYQFNPAEWPLPSHYESRSPPDGHPTSVRNCRYSANGCDMSSSSAVIASRTCAVRSVPGTKSLPNRER